MKKTSIIMLICQQHAKTYKGIYEIQSTLYISKLKLIPIRAELIHSPHDKVHIAILVSQYDTYRDTYL